METSSSLLATPAASSSLDDDGSLSVTAALAKEAALLFQSGKFADCLKVLHQLLHKKEADPKVILREPLRGFGYSNVEEYAAEVLHNSAIAESFQDGFSDPKRLLEVLNNVKPLLSSLKRRIPLSGIGDIEIETYVFPLLVTDSQEGYPAEEAISCCKAHTYVARGPFILVEESVPAACQKRSEELARVSGKNTEVVSNFGSKAIIAAKGTNSMAHQFPAANSSPMVYTDEFDTSVTMFNIAVIWFHLHEYANSFSILEPLYQNIEPIDEGTALRICLLLLDVALLSNHASRSADVINYVEKVFRVNTLISQGDNGSSAQQQTATLVTKSSSFSSITPVPEASVSDSAAITNVSESPLSRTLSEDAEYDNFFSTLGSSAQNQPRPFQSSNDIPRTQADDSISSIDLRLKLHLYKVQFLLLTRNPKAAKREVKMAMNIARGKDYSMALFLKSQLEYAWGNHRKAVKLLMASSNRTEMGTSSIYYNNLGCIYHRLGKHHTSTLFFSKALSNSSSLRKEKPRKLTFSQDKSLLIIYNCGVQYLACGKPIIAARCFHKASLLFYNRPLLWLRIAECCLIALEKGLLKSSSAPCNRSEVKVRVIGKGKWRQLALEDGIPRNGQAEFVGSEDLSLGDDRQPNLSLSLARQCLFNALHILDSSKHSKSGLPSESVPEGSEAEETLLSSKNTNSTSASVGDSQAPNVTVVSSQVNANGEVKEQKGVNNLNATLQSSISDYEVVCRKEDQMIKQALLADLAYVELELANPLKALSMARSLLFLPECSRVYIFLGNVYAAEALCLLNRPKEAAEHLLIYLSSGNNVEMPYSQEDCELWRMEKTADSESNGGSAAANTSLLDESQEIVVLKPEEARGTLYADLATMSALQGDFEQAHKFVMQALSALPNSREAILTAVYVDLMRGKTQEAVAKLKHSSRVRFLPGSLTINGSS
ncbi:hypothetical protein RJ639_010926 [Escallonia herrerae]|uniref:CCR4-NOT transcription complex subunit 10 n=1 Tax=Escallonia herrerae TaxID=1293975 RepID=A0AA88VN90_9ASTE|nr:hypothetical protein RJ639_010926 [Escallonia herrerae]